MNTQKTAHSAEEYLHACIEAEGGSLLWNRAEDGRWYQAQIVVDLLDSSLLLFWGGPLKNRNTGKTLHLDPMDTQARRTLVRRLCCPPCPAWLHPGRADHPAASTKVRAVQLG